MTKPKLLPYFWKSLWVVGLIILAITSFDYANMAQQTMHATASLVSYVWTKFFISILFGLYVSILLVKKWSIKISPSLLICVTIPCLLLSSGYPIWSLHESNLSPSIVFLLMKILSTGVLGTIAGLTLVLGIFNNSSESESQ